MFSASETSWRNSEKFQRPDVVDVVSVCTCSEEPVWHHLCGWSLTGFFSINSEDSGFDSLTSSSALVNFDLWLHPVDQSQAVLTQLSFQFQNGGSSSVRLQTDPTETCSHTDVRLIPHALLATKLTSLMCWHVNINNDWENRSSETWSTLKTVE